MKNDITDEEIEALTKTIKELKLQQSELRNKILPTEEQLKSLSERRRITVNHIGRRVRVLNPNKCQPVEGVVVGFTKGKNPFVKVKESGFTEIKRLLKNLELI